MRRASMVFPELGLPLMSLFDLPDPTGIRRPATSIFIDCNIGATAICESSFSSSILMFDLPPSSD